MSDASSIWLIILFAALRLTVKTLAQAVETRKCAVGESATYVRTEAHVTVSAADVMLEDVSLEECARRCTVMNEKAGSCRSFDYNSNSRRCALRRICGAPVGDEPLADTKMPYVAFFQQICVKTSCKCSAPYAFERITQHMLIDHAMQSVHTQNVETCLRACIESRLIRPDGRRIRCRSVMYFYATRDCFLSRETRQSLPRTLFTAHTVAQQRVDYFENICHDIECMSTSGSHLSWLQAENVEVNSRHDVAIDGINAEDCRRMCAENRANGHNLPCKAFIYHISKRQCRLSSAITARSVPAELEDPQLPFVPIDFRRGSNDVTQLFLGGQNLYAAKLQTLRPIIPINAPPEVLERMADITLEQSRRRQSNAAEVINNDQFYQEKICLMGTLKCDGSSFELVPNRRLNIKGTTFRVIDFSECLERCLLAMTNCSSAMFYRDTNECVINTRTRFSDPDKFHAADGVLYYDNLCQFATDSRNEAELDEATESTSIASTTELTKKSLNPLLRKFRVVFKMTSEKVTSENLSPANIAETPFEEPEITTTLGDSSSKAMSPRPRYLSVEEETENIEQEVELHTECQRNGVRVQATFQTSSTGFIYLRNHPHSCSAIFETSENVTLLLSRSKCEGIRLGPDIQSYIVMLHSHDKNGSESRHAFNITCNFAFDETNALASLRPISYIVDGGVNEAKTNLAVQSQNNTSAKHIATSGKVGINGNGTRTPIVQMLLLRRGRPVGLVDLGEELELIWRLTTSDSEFSVAETLNTSDGSVKNSHDVFYNVTTSRSSGQNNKVEDDLELTNESPVKFQPPLGYGFFVENCTAKRIGAAEDASPVESLPLIIHGCPSPEAKQHLMRSPISIHAGGTELKTTLKVFRFEGSLKVRIYSTISICVEQCEPIQCMEEDGREYKSYGRRKKRQADYENVRRNIFRLPNSNKNGTIRQSTLTSSYMVNEKADLDKDLRFLAPIMPINTINFNKSKSSISVKKELLPYPDRNEQNKRLPANLSISHVELSTKADHVTNSWPTDVDVRAAMLTGSSSTVISYDREEQNLNNKTSICLRHTVFILITVVLVALAGIQLFHFFRFICGLLPIESEDECQSYDRTTQYNRHIYEVEDEQLQADLPNCGTIVKDTSHLEMNVPLDAKQLYSISGDLTDAATVVDIEVDRESRRDSYLGIEFNCETPHYENLPVMLNAYSRQLRDSTQIEWKHQQTAL